MLIFYGDILNTAGLYSTRSASDISTTGSSSASFPVANIYDPNPAKVWKRTGCTAASTVGVRIQFNTVDAYATAAAGVVLMNVRAYNSSGANQPITGGGQVTVGTSAGGTQVATARYFYFPISPDASFAANGLSLFIPLDSATRVNLGGDVVPNTSGSWYVDITLGTAGQSGGNPLDFQIGRVMICPVWSVDCDAFNSQQTLIDDSEIVQSYSGVPFVLERGRRIRTSGRLVGLRNNQVFAPWSNAGYSAFPSVSAVNRTSGKSKFVGIHLVEPTSWTSTSAVQAVQPFSTVGLLDDTIQAQLESYTPDANGGIWSADFSVTEVKV